MEKIIIVEKRKSGNRGRDSESRENRELQGKK